MNILIVDDEPALVEYLTSTVSAYYPSHRVRGAVSATDAIGAAYEEGAIDLLIADVNLGDSDGFEVRSQLQPVFPGMQTVFISGYNFEHLLESAGNPHSILRKPLGPSAIFGAVEAVQHRIRPRIARPDVSKMPMHNHAVMSSSGLSAPFRGSDAFYSPGPSPGPKKALGSAGSSINEVKKRIWLPALLSVLALGVVVTLILHDTRLLDSVSPVNATGDTARAALRNLAQSNMPQAYESGTPAESIPPVTLYDWFEGSDRSLELETQWHVLPLAIGAHEIVAGEGAVRARASDFVMALFAAASASPHYSWKVCFDVRTSETGRIGIVFGFQNPEDYYQLRIDSSALQIAIVRQFDGNEEIFWDAALPANIISSEFPVRLAYDAVNGVLMLTLGEPEVAAANITLTSFEGGHFGFSVTESSFSRFSGFQLTLTPEIAAGRIRR
jgi:CheY-like chemotaxis protein